LITEKWQGTLDPQAIAHFKTGVIHPLVQGLLKLGTQVLGKNLLDVNQSVLPWAVAPMLEGREGNRV